MRAAARRDARRWSGTGRGRRSWRHPWRGIAELPGSLTLLTDALRAGELVGHRGWQDGPGALAVEGLLIADRSLTEAAVRHELGPILADERMGVELVETLDVYLSCGSNMRETARRLHLAHRTVAYRLARIEQLLGHPIDGPGHGRLAVALLGWRSLREAHDEGRESPPGLAGRWSSWVAPATRPLLLGVDLLVDLFLDLRPRGGPWPGGRSRCRRRAATGRWRCRR